MKRKNLFSVVGLFVLVLGVAANVWPEEPDGDVSSRPAAVVEGATISMADVERRAYAKLARVRAEEYNIRRRVLEDSIGQLLLEREAQRREVTVAALVAAEVELKAKRVTEEEARAIYETSRERFPPGTSEESALSQISTGLAKQRLERRRLEYVGELRERMPTFKCFLSPRAPS